MIKLSMTTADGDTIELEPRRGQPEDLVLRITDSQDEHFVANLTHDEAVMMAHFFERMVQR